MKKINLTDIFIWVISAELVGVLSALLSGGFSDFYDRYIQPPLLPPSWLFPVVWTILYALMGFSAYLVYSSDGSRSEKSKALRAYIIQLALNFSWSIIFFRFEALWLAVIVIIALLAAVIVMTVRFYRIVPLAGYLNIPYIIWLAFASYLNIAAALLNT
ncbi:MAG: tryptophan-rich sensory protein [Oscillospiraceae bacterium]|nr:tryptophan-rich sensory protein [Oscillospiraceae bacterium]